MKKIFIIISIIVLVLATIVWFFLSGDGDMAVGGAPATGSPFGSGDSGEGVTVPALNPSFEGGVQALSNTTAGAEGHALFKISSTPVAGFIAITRGTSTIVRYVDRATGHIFDAALPSGNGGGLVETRVTNNTLPQIYEAYFRGDGNAVLLRSLDDNDMVKNMSLALTPPKASSTDNLYNVSLSSLRGDIDSVTVSGNSLLYVLRDTGAITSSAFNGDQVKTVWNSQFRSWRTGRLGANYLIFTKPSASLSGYAYRLTPQGSVTRLLGPLKSLVVVGNPTGVTLLYSYTDSRVHLFTKKVGEGSGVELNPATLAEKCTWSNKLATIVFCGAPNKDISGSDSDNWYRGITHFSDFVWRFDTVTQTATLVMQPKEDFGVDLDIFLPASSPNDQYLIFINKTDQSLWAVKLN